MAHLKKRLDDEFCGIQIYSSPESLWFQATRPTKKCEGINDNKEPKYWSGLGMLLDFVKHSQQDTEKIMRTQS